MKTKVTLLCVMILAFVLSSPVTATELKDLAPTKEQIDRSIDRAEQDRGQREFEKQQERDRERSQAERDIDKIPENTTVKPIIKDGGGGVEVTIPTK